MQIFCDRRLYIENQLTDYDRRVILKNMYASHELQTPLHGQIIK